MLKAYDQFRSNGSEYRLVIVGNKKWWTESMERTYNSMQFKNEVIFTGRVSDADLNEIMGAAFANLYVSTFEGFGIPIIEAFQAGVPVITSNVTSMPEIANDAALLVDPMDVEQITKTMTTLHQSEELRNDLIKKGQKRASYFTWQRSANLLWESIEKVLEEK